MSTALFLRNTATSGIGSFLDLLSSAGASSVNAVVNTAASGTNIQWTAAAGGSVVEWISGRAPSGGFTLSGAVSIKLNANESNTAANAGGRLRLYKRTSAGVETELSGSPSDKGAEFTASLAAITWSFTPSSGMSFAEDDRLIVRFFITNAGGTMAGSRTATMRYNNTSGNTGDTSITLTETVAFKTNDQIYQLSTVNKNARVTLAASNMEADSSTTGGNIYEAGYATFSFSSGKWYFEFQPKQFTSGENVGVGVCNASQSLADGGFLGESGSHSIGWWNSDNVYLNTAITAQINTYAANDWCAVAVDADNGKIYFKNLTAAGNWNNSGSADPATNTGGITIGVTAPLFPAYVIFDGSTQGKVLFNFGATTLQGTIPSGFTAPAAPTSISGSASITEDSDTLSATGTLAIAATATITEANDTTTATGTLAIAGQGTITEADDTLGAAGGRFQVGSASITEDDDTTSSTGTLDLKGSASITEESDTLSAAAALDLKAAASITEDSDTLSATAELSIAASASIAEDDDTLSAAGTTSIVGSASITEDDDSLSATAALAITGSASITEDDDTIASDNTSGLVGEANITEDDDAIVSTGVLAITGSASIVEDDDTMEGSAASPITGAATITEDDDVVQATGALSISGAASLTEDDDTIVATATNETTGTTGQATITEEDDTVVSVATLFIAGSATIDEEDDTLSAAGSISLRFFEADLLEALLADAGVSAIAGSRASWAHVPQGQARPFILLRNDGRRRDYTTGGAETLKRGLVRIDCIADGVRDAVRLRRAVRAALEGMTGQHGSTVFQGVFVDNVLLNADDETDGDPSVADIRARLDLDVWFTGAA